MSETFAAHPREVAGLSVLAHKIADDAWATTNFVREHTRPAGDFGEGVMQVLLSPLTHYGEATARRFDANHENCRGIGVNLNRTAWMYHDQEARNYAALNANVIGLDRLDPSSFGDTVAAPGLAVDYENPARYVARESVDLDAPATAAEDIRDLVAAEAGWLGDIDDAVQAVTGWSAIEEVIKPISGNWNELKRIGESFAIGGEAMESGGKNLAAGAEQVSNHWGGMAEESFQDYARRQVGAMEWEGPVGRLVKESLDAAATTIQDACVEVVRQLADLLAREVQGDSFKSLVKLVSKKVPILGTGYQAVSILEIVMSVRGLVDRLVDRVRGIVDAITGFLEPLIAMSSDITAISEQTLGPIAERVDDARKKAEITADIMAAADADGPFHRPGEDYSPGTGTEPWEDAA